MDVPEFMPIEDYDAGKVKLKHKNLKKFFLKLNAKFEKVNRLNSSLNVVKRNLSHDHKIMKLY